MEINVEINVTSTVFRSNPENQAKNDPAEFDPNGPKNRWSMTCQCLGNLPTISETNGPIGLKFYRRIALAKVGTDLEFQVSRSAGLGMISKQRKGSGNLRKSHVFANSLIPYVVDEHYNFFHFLPASSSSCLKVAKF